MSSKQLTAEERTERRAQYEAFSFAVPCDGKVNIQNNSYGADEARNHVYTVSVDARGHEATDCTCPAAEYRPGKCKHQRAVENNAAVMAAAAPDVREADGDTLADDVTRALARSFTLGVDSEGRTHHYYRPADSVVVFTEEHGIEHRQHLGDDSLGRWIGFVAQDCGWQRRGRLAGRRRQRRRYRLEAGAVGVTPIRTGWIGTCRVCERIVSFDADGNCQRCVALDRGRTA